MPQAVLTLTGTGTGEWSPTPGGTAEADHYTLLSEAYPPGDETSYVQSNGHVLGLIEEVAISEGPSNSASITNLNIVMYASGDTITNSPAFRIELVVGGAVIAQREFGFESGGVFTEGAVNIPLFILGTTWRAGPRILRFIPIDGNFGYGGIPHEED